jgi:hypothetical protein
MMCNNAQTHLGAVQGPPTFAEGLIARVVTCTDISQIFPFFRPDPMQPHELVLAGSDRQEGFS